MARRAAIRKRGEADVGRGVHIFLWGLPPERRLPLRAYHAGITLKNGVPINYIEGISLFEWMEVGFNTFYAFRDGETAWIYSKVLHLLHQLTDVTCFSVYPYQLGDQNEEAIKSGAFWFYRKLGFRPGRPELLAMTQREEAKMAGRPVTGHRLAYCANWRRSMCFTNLAMGRSGLWDTFSTRNIGLRCATTHGQEIQWRSSRRCVAPRPQSLARILRLTPKGGTAGAVGIRRTSRWYCRWCPNCGAGQMREAGAGADHPRQSLGR